MSPLGYLTFETFIYPTSGKNSLRGCSQPKVRVYSPEERVLFLHIYLDGDTVHDLLLYVKRRDHPGDDEPQRRVNEVHPWALPKLL